MLCNLHSFRFFLVDHWIVRGLSRPFPADLFYVADRRSLGRPNLFRFGQKVDPLPDPGFGRTLRGLPSQPVLSIWRSLHQKRRTGPARFASSSGLLVFFNRFPSFFNRFQSFSILLYFIFLTGKSNMALQINVCTWISTKRTCYLNRCKIRNIFFCSKYYLKHNLCNKKFQEGHRNQPCTVVFLFVYFFGSAVANWFTATSIVWCVASSTSNVSKRIVSVSTVSTLTHVFGWGIPAVLTIVAIVAHQVFVVYDWDFN